MSMSEPVELEQLGDATPSDQPPGLPDLRRLGDVPIDLTVEIGRTRMTVSETLDLHRGSVVTLNRMAGEPVDLLVNGTAIARGEVVVIDEQFGVRITEIVGQGASAGQSTEGAEPQAPPPGAD